MNNLNKKYIYFNEIMLIDIDDSTINCNAFFIFFVVLVYIK